MSPAQFAKALTPLALGLVAIGLDALDVDLPGDVVDQAVAAIVTAVAVYIIPNRG